MWDNFTFEEVLESLEELYEEWDFESTYDEFILQQFEMFENSDSVDLFLDLYNDTNRNNYLRCHSALMLGRIGDKRVFEDLIKIVENKNENSHFRRWSTYVGRQTRFRETSYDCKKSS